MIKDYFSADCLVLRMDEEQTKKEFAQECLEDETFTTYITRLKTVEDIVDDLSKNDCIGFTIKITNK